MTFSVYNIYFLLKIECECDDFAACIGHGCGVWSHIGVPDIVRMIGVETVGEAIHELQFGA